MQRIWQWRHGIGDEVDPWTEAVTSSAFRSSMRSAIHKAASHAAQRSSTAVGGICRGFLHLLEVACPPVPSAICHAGRYLLFFDGGSRGNPGPGGAGAVVVHVDVFGSNARLVWSAAMSLASAATTNNLAEYAGLVHGLTAATKNGWRPLEVIGDSAMIITQMRDSRAPKHPRLRKHYGRARIMSDTLGVVQWHHHVRAYNKMADAAANLAMDHRRSLQSSHPTDRPDWQVLHAHLSGDLNQWRASTHPGSSSSVV